MSLRPIKAIAANLSPIHPLRILLKDEPDEMGRAEFASKIVGWFRLLCELPAP